MALIRLKSRREEFEWQAKQPDQHMMAGRSVELTAAVNLAIKEAISVSLGSRLLDLGCGDGSLLELLAPQIAQGLGVVPTVIQVNRLRETHGQLANVSFAVGAADHVDALEGTFDVIVCNSVFHYLSNADEAFAALLEMRRLLAPGGLAFVGEVASQKEIRQSHSPVTYVAFLVRNGRMRDAAYIVRQVVLAAAGCRDYVWLSPFEDLCLTQDEMTTLARHAGFTDVLISPTPRYSTRFDYQLR
jgi:ubiquinone/menaquinone biosynthesis C-methylase UbiE